MRNTDPGLLELVGELADLLGLAERIQRFLPTQRLKVQRKHRRLEKLLDAFNDALSDARTALRVLSTTVDRHLEAENGTATKIEAKEPLPRIAFSMPSDELPVYRRGVEQLQSAISRMTKVAFDLEATSAGVSDEVQRYYKISQAGNGVLRNIRHALDDNPESIPNLVREVEQYLARCSNMLEERHRWLQQ